MTLPTDTRYRKYLPVVSTDTFDVVFPIFDAAEIDVYIDGVLTVDYSVTATFSGGRSTDAQVVLDTAISSGTLEVYGKAVAERTTNYAANNPNLGQNLQDDMDRIVAVQQEQKRDFGAALLFPVGESVSNILPASASRASKLLGFDSNGDPTIIAGLTPGSVSVSSFMEPTLLAANMSSFFQSLGASSAVRDFLDEPDKGGMLGKVYSLPVTTSSNVAFSATDNGGMTVSSADITVTADVAVIQEGFQWHLFAGAGTKITINDGSSNVCVLYGEDAALLRFNGTSLFISEYRKAKTGSWTPALQDSGANAAGLLLPFGEYTRVGRKVELRFSMTVTSVSGMTGGDVLRLVGYPFAPASSLFGSGDLRANAVTGLAVPYSTFVTGLGYIAFEKSKLTTSNQVLVSDVSAGTTTIVGTMTYLTDDA